MANENKQYFPSMTACLSTAKITDIRNNGDYYFAKVSYVTGKDQWQHVNLLVGSSLQKFAKRVVDGEQALEDINPCTIEVDNLHFSADVNESDASRPYLNNKGVLMKISRSVF